ncbi:MAG: DNA/RNA nuclease SfsA [Planctomycetota bacterium]|nr:DNA/RNA nuclease SfsA [Planctomycetota bacterium]
MVQLELIEARLVRRYKRFLADCEIPDQGEVVAHCPNPGSMKTLIEGTPRAWLKYVDHPKRKLQWTLTLLEVGEGDHALVDTSLPNAIVADAIVAGQVPRLGKYSHLRREVAIGQGTRLDMVLGEEEDPDEETGHTFIEVKNVTMKSAHFDDRCDFPDSVTTRGKKHLEVLTKLASSGRRAVLFLLLGRTDARRVGFACEIDPAYCQALERAVAAGVEVISHQIRIDPGQIDLGAEVPVQLP